MVRERLLVDLDNMVVTYVKTEMDLVKNRVEKQDEQLFRLTDYDLPVEVSLENIKGFYPNAVVLEL